MLGSWSLWQSWLGGPPVVFGWTGAICLSTVLAGISTAWVLRLCRQTGTLEEPGHSSTLVAVGTTAAGNWGLSTSSSEDMDLHAVSPGTGVGLHIDSAKWWNSDLLFGVNRTFDII